MSLPFLAFFCVFTSLPSPPPLPPPSHSSPPPLPPPSHSSPLPLLSLLPPSKEPLKYPTDAPANLPLPPVLPGETILLKQHRVACLETFSEPAVGSLYITNFRLIFNGNSMQVSWSFSPPLFRNSQTHTNFFTSSHYPLLGQFLFPPSCFPTQYETHGVK